MKKLPKLGRYFVFCFSAALALASCNTAERNEEQTTTPEEARITQLDSVETSIENSVERLENKAKELRQAMADLDTTALNQ